MKGSTHSKLTPSLVLSALLGSMLLTSCASAANRSQETMVAPTVEASAAGAGASESLAKNKDLAPHPHPQLVKKANLLIIVNSIENSIEAVSKIVKEQQGDVLGFEDQKPQSEYSRHTASMQIQVPQEKLDATLDALNELGTVQRRTLTAEDVTSQLVDYEARLRNLRKQESTLLTIMDRSGSISDVLKVAQELSNVRQSIEEIDGQLKSLHNQVAYSTISLQLEAPVASIPTEQPLGLQIQETWNQASHSVGNFTLHLVQSGIQLAVWIPYLLLLGGGAWFGYTRFKQRQSSQREQTSDTANSG